MKLISEREMSIYSHELSTLMHIRRIPNNAVKLCFPVVVGAQYELDLGLWIGVWV